MDKDKGEKSIKSSKDSKSSKSIRESKEVKEKREYKDARESRRERDGRGSKRSKDVKETESEHRRQLECRSERAGRTEREGRGERESRSEREGRREQQRNGRSKRDGRSERDERHDHDKRSERDTKGERASRRDRELKSERESKHERNSRSALTNRREHESKSHSESRSERLSHTKSSTNVKEDKCERTLKDKKLSKDVKEVKSAKDEKGIVVEDKAKTAMQDIKELIMRALECELGGHILEARMLYEESLAKLQACSSEEKNEEISESYRKYLSSYEKHVQRLRDQIEQNMFACKIIEHIAIPEGIRGRSFEKLFGCYLDEKVSLVHIYEPCLTQSSQLEHLINFIEVLVKNCPNLMFLRVITRASPKSSKLQSEVLRDLREELESGNISFNYQFDEQLKKPRIILNTGVVIRCRRGLHIYKPMLKYYKLGLYDYDFRRCESAEFDVYQGKPFSEAISKADRTDLMESLLHA